MRLRRARYCTFSILAPLTPPPPRSKEATHGLTRPTASPSPQFHNRTGTLDPRSYISKPIIFPHYFSVHQISGTTVECSVSKSHRRKTKKASRVTCYTPLPGQPIGHFTNFCPRGHTHTRPPVLLLQARPIVALRGNGSTAGLCWLGDAFLCVLPDVLYRGMSARQLGRLSRIRALGSPG